MNWNFFRVCIHVIVAKLLYGSFTVFLQVIKDSLKAGSVTRQRIIISIIVQIAIVNGVEQIILENVE